jgi:hypothetical protein
MMKEYEEKLLAHHRDMMLRNFLVLCCQIFTGVIVLLGLYIIWEIV